MRILHLVVLLRVSAHADLVRPQGGISSTSSQNHTRKPLGDVYRRTSHRNLVERDRHVQVGSYASSFYVRIRRIHWADLHILRVAFELVELVSASRR